METHTHRTATGTYSCNAKRSFNFVSVGIDRDGNHVAYAWHAKAPKSPAFSYFANCYIEPINGGTR
jgi:hypothetical protein